MDDVWAALSFIAAAVVLLLVFMLLQRFYTRVLARGFSADLPALARTLAGLTTIGAVAVPIFSLDLDLSSINAQLGGDGKSGSIDLPSTAPGPPASGTATVIPTRIFAGPDQYPPPEFRAYGIVAFPTRAVPGNRSRYLMICEAYIAVLPHTSEIKAARSEQMGTAWPVDGNANADSLNRMRRSEVCAYATDHYGLLLGKTALKDAKVAGVDVSGIGPLLLAWSPAVDKGRPGAPVLVADLGEVTTFDQAQEVFLRWSRDIERAPALWERGWNLERLRTTLRYWADKWGPRLLTLHAAEGG